MIELILSDANKTQILMCALTDEEKRQWLKHLNAAKFEISNRPATDGHIPESVERQLSEMSPEEWQGIQFRIENE